VSFLVALVARERPVRARLAMVVIAIALDSAIVSIAERHSLTRHE
jgi:hypothetical protein